MIPELLNTKQAARRCGLSPRTLERYRLKEGAGPPFIRLGGAVRYELGDLLRWIEQGRRTSTRDPGPGG